MKIHDLYGIACPDLGEARAKVESALGVTLVAHESDYRCGDYYLYTGPGEEQFILQRNFDSFDNEWTEPDSKDKPFLLYLTATNRSDELRDKLAQVDGIELVKTGR